MTWGARAIGWGVTAVGAITVGIVAFRFGWPALATTGWMLLVIALGVWVERGRQPRVTEVTHCHFCGRTRHEVSRLIAAPDLTAICSDCVRLSAELLDQAAEAPGSGPLPAPPAPPGDPWTPPES